jgi:hypothetical protein
MTGRRSGDGNEDDEMDAAYEGKTVAQWIDLLESGYVPQRCAAALALAELGPKTPPAKKALLAALHDMEKPVQVAAQIAIGFIYAPAENRRRMFDYLLGDDEDKWRQTLGALEELAYSSLLGTASEPEIEEIAVTGPVPYRAPAAAPIPASAQPPPDNDVLDIAVVTVLPWWFLFGAVALCLTLSWLLRGIWWSKWVMIGLTALACVFLYYTRTRQQSGKLSLARYRSRARTAWSAIFATLFGFGIGILFPVATVIIDNESGATVRIFLDGKEWLTSSTGESKGKSLAAGKYRVTILDAPGNALDEHFIQVSANQQYILNVLGAQVYFRGVVVFGGGEGDIKIIDDRWLQVPEVDYLFCDPPDKIRTVFPVRKTFFTRGVPPRMKAG